MENQSVFEFTNYKDYLANLVGSKDKRSGLRSKLAKVIGCQTTYVSQVLYSDFHFSQEQAERISDFLGHSKDEKLYFLLLINKNRAGTKFLEKFYDEQLLELLNKRMILTERLGTKVTLNEIQQSVYYSSWQYSAVHVALTVPGLQTIDQLYDCFRISKSRLSLILEFLCESGLAKKDGNKYYSGEVQIRLGNRSSQIIKHHSNWRHQAIFSLEREGIYDLHYSGVVSLSTEDVIKVKDQIFKYLQEILKTIKASSEEQIYSFNIDFFNLDTRS